MIRAIIFDFSRVLLDIKDKSYSGSLNGKHKDLKDIDGFNLFDHFELNEELISYLTPLAKKVSLYIYTTGLIHTEPEVEQKINHLFKKSYTVADCGPKENAESFLRILDPLELNPEQVLFIDDTEKNINAAKTAGLHTIHFKNNQQLFSELKSYLE